MVFGNSLRDGICPEQAAFRSFDRVTPAFRVDFIDAAEGIDIPAELYETGLASFAADRSMIGSVRWRL